MTSSDNKTIAKNAIVLFIRMVIVTIVGLFTSRVILSTLGVTDYGIYNLVCGLISMIAFLNASMSAATSRFITYELGRSDIKRQTEIFSTSLIIHALIALVVVVFSEIVGLWLIYNHLDIPSNRLDAAVFVFQMSVVSTAISITQVPYSATIIAHEKMSIYAYLELLNVFAKLGIVYLLLLTDQDRLKLYALLMCGVSIIFILIYRVYCIRKFESSHFIFIWGKTQIKSMLSFVGQDLTAKFAYSVRVQSVGIILNMFFGVIVNAANGIATTVNGSVSAFSSNMFVAFNPQIIKNYASGNINRMLQLIYTSSKYSLLLISIAVIPLELEMGYVLRLWLGSVPEYCQIFCQITLFSLLTVCTQSIYTGLQATGDIKQYSIVQTITYLLCPIIMYILCRFFRIPSLAYIVVIVTQFVTVSILVFIFKQKVQAFSIRTYAVQIFQALFVITIAVIVGIVIHKQLTESFLRLSLITVCSAIIILSSAFIMLDKTQRHVVISNIRNRIKI